MKRLKWPFVFFLRYYRHLGLRIALYALLSLVIALVSPVIEGLLPEETTKILEFSSVIPVLTILASSMLAVSTFSLNVMVSAHRAAAQNTTPRVHRLLLEDMTTQSVLAVFIGAFVFSLSSIVLYQSGFYTEGAAVIVMAVTIFVVVTIILAMLRWIDHLSNLGSVDDSIRKVVNRAGNTLRNFAHDPSFGANALSKDTVLPLKLTELRAPSSGYLQLVNVNGLQEKLLDQRFIYVARSIGSYVLAGDVVAHVSGRVTEDEKADLLNSFVFGSERTFEQDVTFGLTVLSEIGAKALSPGINDSGTAIQSILHLKSLFWSYAQTERKETARDAPNVFLSLPDAQALLEAAFLQIARDGAGQIEVALCLRQALLDLTDIQDADMKAAAQTVASLAMEYAKSAGLNAFELKRLESLTAI